MSIEAMKQALEAFEMYLRLDTVEDSILLEQVIAPEAIATLRAAIEQAQEPVAWMYEWDGRRHLTFTDQRFIEKSHPHFNKSTPLYTYPPQRSPLTAEEIEQCCYEADSKAADHPQTWKWTEAFARAIEASLLERNT